MPSQNFTIPGSLEIQVNIPDTVNLGNQVTVATQMRFGMPSQANVPGAPTQIDPNHPQPRFHIPMWGWIVGGIIMILLGASLFFAFSGNGGSSKSHASTNVTKLDPVEDQIERGAEAVESGMADLSEAKEKLDKFGKKLDGSYEAIRKGLPNSQSAQPTTTQPSAATTNNSQSQPPATYNF